MLRTVLANEVNVQNDFSKIVGENQRSLAAELASGFDYIVCGAGTSGCVVAARLAADPTISVLLLEAGGGDETDLIGDPNRWPMTLGSELDWKFVAEPNARLNGRAIRYSMGNVLGGGSSINVSTWSRGHRADWDFFADEAGDAAWSHPAVLDLYRGRIEAWAGHPDLDYRGMDGTVHVQPAADPHPFALAFLEGARSLGLERFPNPNGRMMEAAGGCALVDETARHRRRQAFHQPDDRSAGGLSLIASLIALALVWNPQADVQASLPAARNVADRPRSTPPVAL